MSTIKTLALATVLIFGASQLAVAQYGSGPSSGGSTMSGSKAQKSKNGDAGKNTGSGAGTGQGQD